ncbi:MAG: hypothetical protein JWQ34_3319 [Mucilaginibacter sp.]|uniref:hypothetical protein n=1 Tax=Mucilaginibacter sp. TaxID=1882438 RepID=UPI00262B774F|nr:hypothetical protein [Mucilaginibacter sp.]MDB5005094.1 hypothetical protein [Mucilaginibacter sp.]
MKQLEVFNKIGGIIKELNDQYKYIEANPENLNDLELELFVANAHFLADHAEILSKLNLRSKALKAVEPQKVIDIDKIIEQKRPTVNEKFFEPVVQQPKRDPTRVELANTTPKADEPVANIDLSTDTPKDSYSFIMEQPEVIRHELVVDDDIDENLEEEVIEPVIEEPEEEETSEEFVAVEEPKARVKEVEKSIAKKEPVKDKEEVITINQKISAQLSAKNNVTEQAIAQPVTNLKQAITLNDKLLYIKDLFNGYNLAYSEAIEILNRFNTFEEANRFLNKNYTLKNNWDSKPETSDKFFALLKRRYS